MLYVNKNTIIPGVQKTIGILQSYSDSIGVPLDYDRLLEYYSYNTIKAERIAGIISRYTGLGMNFTANDMYSFLKSQGVTKGFLMTDKGRDSMSADSLQCVIDTGLYSKELCSLMEAYINMVSKLHLVNMFQGIIDSREPVKGMLSYDNRRMIFVNPKWSALNTGRLQMSEPALFNVSRDLKDIETVPQGWILLDVDSGQIEPRIIYSHYIADKQIKKLIEIYNDAYFGLLHYVTMPKEDILSGRLDFTPMEITEELKKKRAHLKTLGNAVNYGSGKNDMNDPLKVSYIERIGNHPLRKEWASKISRAVQGGQTVFHTVFGTPIDITSGPGSRKYVQGSDAYYAHLERCALNNPVQGTAADLMRLSVFEANKIIQNKAPNSFITRYTHDSGKFAIHESEYDKVEKELKGITEYTVENWIPIYGDPIVGRKELTKHAPYFIK